MCTVPAVISTGLQIGGNYLSQKAMYEAGQATIDAQAKAAITEMNYAFQGYEQERVDAFDSTVAELMKARQNALRLNSGVRAAVNENVSGRTGNLLVRAAEGDAAEVAASIKDNYARKSNEIDLNKEATLKSTQSYIDNLNASAPKMPSRLANFVSSAATIMGSYTNVQNQKADVESKGLEWDSLWGGAKSSNGGTYDLYQWWKDGGTKYKIGGKYS